MTHETICTRRMTAASRQAAVFLLPPHATAHERREALLDAAELARQAVEVAVRAGRDDVAFELLGLAQRIESGK